jgi:predicted lipid-binding transport protein (Tim44 family)
MRRPRVLLAALLTLALAFAPALGMAAAGGGSSFGSRGTHTYMAPPSTNTSPYGAAPMQRSLTPRPAPAPAYGTPGYGTGYGGRSAFMSGLMGGLIGAGIGGLLFGHGLFGGITGFGSVFGLLLQIMLIAWLVRWLLRRFAGQPATAGAGMFARGNDASAPPLAAAGVSVGTAGRGLEIGPDDYKTFEQLLHAVQDAWSAHDLNRMRALATPEMVSVFADQMAEQSSRGVRNIVSDVRLEQGDLAEAWSERGHDYATVAMRFAMHDATRDAAGHVVDGSVTEWVSTIEYWTFLRVPGGRWVLSAIQQAR